jgi:hypothetical protein
MIKFLMKKFVIYTQLQKYKIFQIKRKMDKKTCFFVISGLLALLLFVSCATPCGC